MPRLHDVVNYVGGIECVVAIEEYGQADKDADEAVVASQRRGCDFFAYVDLHRSGQGDSRVRGLCERAVREYTCSCDDTGTLP